MSRYHRVVSFAPAETIAAGETREILSELTEDIHVERIVIASTIANSFSIEAIKIGDNLQLGTEAYPMLAEIFVPLNDEVLLISPAKKGEVITLAVTNLSAGALHFKASMFGPSAKGLR
jgi:hypothetical protein